MATGPPLKPTDEPTREADKAILTEGLAAHHSGKDVDWHVITGLLVQLGVLDHAFTADDVEARFQALCRSMQDEQEEQERGGMRSL